VVNHGKTAKNALRMQWDYPVYQIKQVEGQTQGSNRTGGASVLSALPREQAFLYIAGDDPRPLLILRECEFCNGTDKALLSKTEGNEKTLLMARWFHCVKLPTHILKEDHPFTNMFTEFPAKKVPHLFLTSRDGSYSIPLKGDQSQSELWKAMENILAVDYAKSPRPVLKEVKRFLIKYDNLDAAESILEEKMQAELEKNGPKSKKLKKIRKDLAKIETDRQALKDKEAKLMNLHIRRPKVEKDLVINDIDPAASSS
jgi:ribosomal protein L29